MRETLLWIERVCLTIFALLAALVVALYAVQAYIERRRANRGF